MKKILVIILSLLLLVSFSLSVGCKKAEKPAESPGMEKQGEAPMPAPEKPAEAPAPAEEAPAPGK